MNDTYRNITHGTAEAAQVLTVEDALSFKQSGKAVLIADGRASIIDDTEEG